MAKKGLLSSAAAYCARLTQKSQSNFYYAFLFLPRERRAALEAVYAYCRLVDDVVDEAASPAEKLAGIERWRRELDAIFGEASGASRGASREAVPSGMPASIDDGTLEHPVSSRLREAVRRFDIRREDLEAVIDGCAMDIEKTRYADWDELRLYCYRVASAVGLMCIQIFGYPADETKRVREYAIDLGIALQLTNILRDVAEDARRGRIYLPQEDLHAFGVTEEELTSPDAHAGRSDAFLRLMRFEAARARAHYLRARAAIGERTKRQLVIAEIMGDIYYAILCRLEESNFDVFGPRLGVRRRQKMAIALRNFAQAKLAPFMSISAGNAIDDDMSSGT
jgi:phytoene synthase